MPEMHLRQLVNHLQKKKKKKNKERIQKFKETSGSRHIYQNKLDKPCFQHDMAYGDLKDLTRKTVSDKILYDNFFYCYELDT